MEKNQVNMWLSMNADKFSLQDLMYIRNTLEAMPNEQMMLLQGVEFKKPSTIFLIAILLGWERFFLNDIALGIVKVITGYGCGIWWLIDIFSAKKRAMKYNFQLFQKATGIVGNNSTPFVSSTDSLTQSDTATENVDNTETQAQRYYAAPANDSNATFNSLASANHSFSIIESVKNIFISPKTIWESIDKEDSLQTGYLVKMAAIPAVALFLGFLLRGIYYAIKLSYGSGRVFGSMFLYGILSAITAYILIMVLGFLSVLVPFLFAEKFGSVKSYKRAFALTAYAMTPLCLVGILLLFSSPFLFWLWVIVGIFYGRYLIYSGTQTLLKTPLEKHTLYVGICADVFFVLSIIMSLILFVELQSFNHLNFYHY